MATQPKVLAIVPSLIASCQINVLKPLKVLHSQGRINFRWQLEAKAALSDIHWADIIVFCRNTEPAYGHLLNEAVCTSKPIIYDLDDNFWDIPYDTDSELARYHRLPPRLQQLEQFLTLSTLVRVYSPVLEQRVSKFSSRTKLLKAGFDFSLVNGKSATGSKKVRIVYATSRIVDDQYYEFLGGIIKILDEYKDQVSLTLWGCQPSELAGRRNVELLDLLPDYERFLREFYLQGFDIGLAPLPNTLFHRSKNNTKFRDYGACRVAGIYSNVDIYSSCVENGKTGIIVENTTDDWYRGIKSLIDDPKLLQSIKDSAHESVYSEYRQELIEEEWMAEISALLAKSRGYAASTATVNLNEMRVRSDFQGLYGIRIPGHSPDGEPVGKVVLEILSPSRDVLRAASESRVQETDDGDLIISFEPIVNSKKQEFIFRMITLDESGDAEPAWMPPSGLIQMLYPSRSKVAVAGGVK